MVKTLGSSCNKSLYLVKVKRELFLSPWFFHSSLSFLFSPFPHVLFSSPPSFSHFFGVTPVCLGVDRVLSACKCVPSVLLHDWEIGFLPKLFPVLSHTLTPFSHCHTLLLFFYPPIFFRPLHNLFFFIAFSPSVFYAAARLIDQCILIYAPAWFVVAAQGKKEWEWIEWSGGGKKEIIIEHAKPLNQHSLKSLHWNNPVWPNWMFERALDSIDSKRRRKRERDR